MHTFVRLSLLPLTILLAIFSPVLALAQTSAGVPADIDWAGLCATVLDGIAHKNWWMVAGPIVTAITWGLRAGVLSKLPGKAGLWFHDHPIAGYAAPFAVATGLGSILSYFASGVPFSFPALMGEVVKVSAVAIATFIGAKTVAESRSAGVAAAATVDSKSAAVELLGKGPQP